MKSTFTIYANSGGCPQNQLDGAHLYNYLTYNGYRYTESVEKADVIIINSCAYRVEKEQQSLEAYHALAGRARKNAKIIFSGCLPKIAPSRLADLAPGVSVIPGTDLSAIEALIPPAQSTWTDSAPNSVPGPMLTYVKPFRRMLSSCLNFCRSGLPYSAARHFDRLLMYDHSSDTFIVRVARGCLGQCTYCAIRFSRGKLKSKALAEILSEVHNAVNMRVNEVLLTATDLAAYGRDIGIDLSVLLRGVLNAAPNVHLLLFYANPRWMIDIWGTLEDVFKSQRIHFIHLALNGGSDHVLEGMRRGYTLGEFETLVRSIKRISPLTILQTQVITGFPGETEADFEETMAFFRHNYFHNVQV
ncbi:MAG: radical SAM protein, partial [Bacteroidetes bacterium]|nr:radical SAM protein [Bacteroidota bacterium]